jgi:hypothetical protein
LKYFFYVTNVKNKTYKKSLSENLRGFKLKGVPS